MSVGAVQEHFPPDVTRPLAQLIVLDAAHGDSNVIDLCTQTIAPNGRYLERSWERYLIDTGPPHAQVASNVVRVLETYKQPKNHKGNAPPSEPRVNMVQFTHTDEDHSGGGAKFLQTLATNKNLQKRFEKTQLLFHKLPIQDPGWTLVLKNTVQNQAYPFTVSCFSQAWHDYAVNFGSGAANIMVRYTFTLDNTPSTTSDSPDLLIDKKHIKNKKTITVTCVVTLLGRRHVGRTNQLVEFQMRKYHKDMFTVKKSFLGSIQQTGPSLIPQTDPVVKRKKLADFKDKKDPRYDAVTRQLVPDYERRRADQTYHDIEGALPALREIDDERSMSRQQRQRLPPLLQWPVVSPKQGDSYSENNLSLASVDFVGPTKTIYQEFIGDCMRVEYDQGVVDEDPGDPALDALGKESELHNMASIVTLFRRYSTVAARVQRGTPLFSMLYTGDAHDRECQIRDTVLGFAGSVPARPVDVLKIPHHGSLCSTSVEFYNRITARVYLICAKQNNHGLPNLRILEAMVSHTAEGHGPTAHLFFSNPDSLWNLKSNSSPSGVQSNLNILLTGPHRPGANGPGTFNYKCYIMKHRKSPWNWKSNSLEKNAGIILLGHNNNGELVITAPEKYWDIWDAARVQKLNTTGGDSLRSYWQLR